MTRSTSNAGWGDTDTPPTRNTWSQWLVIALIMLMTVGLGIAIDATLISPRQVEGDVPVACQEATELTWQFYQEAMDGLGDAVSGAKQLVNGDTIGSMITLSGLLPLLDRHADALDGRWGVVLDECIGDSHA